MEKNKRAKLIDSVRERGRLFDALAVNEALRAVRSGDSKDMVRAKSVVDQSDNRNKFAEEIVDLICEFWPKDTKE